MDISVYKTSVYKVMNVLYDQEADSLNALYIVLITYIIVFK